MTKEEIETRLNYLLDYCLSNQMCDTPSMFTNAVYEINKHIEQLKTILDIFKSNVAVCIDYKGSNPNNICYLLIFNNGNQSIIKEITKEQYDILKEWKEND